MSKLLNQKKAIGVLKRHGWTQSVGGKHSVKMIKPGQRPITLPHHRGADYGPGLTSGILRAAGLDRDDV